MEQVNVLMPEMAKNFCHVYSSNLQGFGPLTIDVKNANKGGFLIQAIKLVFKQKNASNMELGTIISHIRNETLRLAKGENNKKWKKTRISAMYMGKTPANQIPQSTNNIDFQVYFRKAE